MSAITDVLKYSRSWLWDYLKPILTLFLTGAGKNLLEMAFELVQKVATDPTFVSGDPEKRRRWVADQLKQHGITTGTPWADSLINLAIELAVQKLKAKSL